VRILPYGDAAIFVDLEMEGALDRVRRTHAVAAALRERLPRCDVVVGAGTVVVAEVSPWDDVEPIVVEALGAPLPRAEAAPLHVVRAVYDGPDLDDVAARAGLDRRAVAEAHAAREYLVELVGFLPGFAYLGELDPRLVLPRRASPRPRVAKGSIGVAGAHTGIYPLASPGGWNLIARAVDCEPFDPRRDPPVLFAPGHRVRFEIADVA
jgi:KipI family sensor histidine kinase inhibitor